ncbi:MAG: DUF2341 domain-containing protein, partial [Candidatus Woesearchaeota archaeon]
PGHTVQLTQSWYHDDWQYRIPLNVTGLTQRQDEYVINLTLDTATPISQGKMENDCADLRVVDQANDTLNHHVAESPGIACNTGSTSILIQADHLNPEQDNIIYAYYGNPSATDTSSLSQVSSYQEQQVVAYVVSSTLDTEGSAETVSLADGNDVTLGEASNTLDQQDILSTDNTAYDQTTGLETTSPVSAAGKGSWKYKKPITITENSNATLEEYQVPLRIDTATLIAQGKMESDCSDLRIGDETSGHYDYYLDDYTTACGENDTLVWAKIPELQADTAKQAYLYYGNPSATDESDLTATFTYTEPRTVGYLVNDRYSQGRLDLLSLSDDNEISVGTTTRTLGKHQTDTTINNPPTGSPVKAKGLFNPLSQAGGVDMLSPVSWAGTEFAYSAWRRTDDRFCMLAPFDNATVEIRDSGVVEWSGQVNDTVHCEVMQIGTSSDGNDPYPFHINATEPILVTYYYGTDGDALTLYPTTTDELYGNPSATVTRAVSGPQATTYDYHDSDGDDITGTSIPAYYNDTGYSTSSRASGPAIKVNGSQPIGAQGNADADGVDATILTPRIEHGTTYGSPDTGSYIALATQRSTASCTLYELDGTVDSTSSASGGTQVHKMEFYTGSAGDELPQGWYLECDEPAAAIYDADPGSYDEMNMWGIKQMRQQAHPAPTYSVGGEEEIQGTDALTPASFASDEYTFVLAGTDHHFDLYSPYTDATVELYAGNDGAGWTLIDTTTLSKGGLGNLTADSSNNGEAYLLNATADIYAAHKSQNTATGYTYSLHPPSKDWWGVPSTALDLAVLRDGTNITIRYSDGTTDTYTGLQAGEDRQLSGFASDGAAPAVHITATAPIGATQRDDGDGSESVILLPEKELSVTYAVPTQASYIAVAATRPNTQCDLTTPSGGTLTTAVTSQNQDYPHPSKWYYGSDDGAGIPAGSLLTCTNPVYAYYEKVVGGDQDQETNLWNAKQSRQHAYPNPYTTVAVEEEREDWMETSYSRFDNSLATNNDHYLSMQVLANTTAESLNVDDYNLVTGSQTEAGSGDLAADDNNHHRHEEAGGSLSVEYGFTTTHTSPGRMTFTIKGMFDATNDEEVSVSIYDHDSSSWRLLDTRITSASEQTVYAELVGEDLSRYVDGGGDVTIAFNDTLKGDGEDAELSLDQLSLEVESWDVASTILDETLHRTINPDKNYDVGRVWNDVGGWPSGTSIHDNYTVLTILRNPSGQALVNQDYSAIYDTADFELVPDTDAPTFGELSYDEAVGYGQNVSLAINVSDGTDVDSAWADVTLPNGTTRTVSLTRNYSFPRFNGEKYLYTGVFNDTWEWGAYNITIHANDTNGYTDNTLQNQTFVRANMTATLGLSQDNYTPDTNVTFEGSWLNNTGATNNSFRLLAEVYNSTGNLMNTTINRTARDLASGGALNLTQEWADAGYWNTNGHPNGDYTVRILLVSPYDETLTDDSRLNMSWEENFTIEGDTEPPVISDVQAEPPVQGYGANTTISFKATDNGVIDTVTINVTDPLGRSTIEELAPLSGDTYAYDYPKTWEEGTYSFNITVNDTWSYNASAAGNFDVEANTTTNLTTVQDEYNREKIVRITSPYEWLNTTWKYRFPVTIPSPSDAVMDKPITTRINFTEKMEELGVSGKLDANSIRIVEYHANGSLKEYDASEAGDEEYFVPHQSHASKDVDTIDNAVYDLYWRMKGNTTTEDRRTYFIYFDIIENGAKPLWDDGYGEEHMVLGNTNDENNYTVLKGKLQFPEFLGVGVDKGSGSRGFALADIDGDHRLDLLHGADGNVFWASQLDNGSYQDEGIVNTNVGELGPPRTYGLVGADFDNDGHTDVLATGENDEYYLYHGDGGSSFTSTNLSLGLSGSPRGKDLAWLDDDHLPDVVSGHSDGTIYTLVNNGTSFNTTVVGSMSGEVYCVAAGDFDGDGDEDFIAADDTDMRFWENDGSMGYTDTVIRTTGSDVTCDAYDLDRDGDLDLVYAESSTNDVYLLEGNGDGTFQPRTLLTSSLTSDTTYGVALPPHQPDVTLQEGDTEEQSGNDEASYTLNTGDSSTSPYVLMELQNWTGSSWDTLDAVVDEKLSYTVGPDEVIDLRQLFQDNGNWNTSAHAYGWYRILVTLRDNESANLTNADGTLMQGSYNFSIVPDLTPPDLNEISVEPSHTGYNHNITIETYYNTDDTDQVEITITYPNGTVVQDYMTKATTYAFTYTHEDTYETGQYDLEFNSTDAAGNWAVNQSNFTITGETESALVTVRDSYLQDEVVALAGLGEWWDNNWKNRKPVIFTETSYSDLEDHQVPVVMDTETMIDDGSLRSDCSDLRFVLENETVLNHYIDPVRGCDRNDTKIWVEVLELDSGTGLNAYLYYNNSAAPDVSDFSDTFTKESVTNNLEASWHMDAGSGTTVHDSSGNGFYGTFQGSPSWAGSDGGYWKDTSVVFDYGDAVHLDHNGDWIDMGDVLNGVFGTGSDAWTITGWIKPEADHDGTSLDSNHGTNNVFLAKASDSANDNIEVGFENGQLEVYLDTNAAGDTMARIGTGITVGEWQFVAVRYDGSIGEVDVWINGSKYSDTSTWSAGSMDSAAGSNFALGRTNHEEVSNYEGELDEFKVYGDLLEDEEVTALYERRKHASEQPDVSFGEEERILVDDPAFLGANAGNLSYINNTGTTEINYRLLLTVEYRNSSGDWEHTATVINDTGYRSIAGLTETNLATLWWGAGAWNTSSYSGGTYRARHEMLDDDGRLLRGSDGSSMNASYEFIIDRDDQPPQYTSHDLREVLYLGEDRSWTVNWTDNIGLSHAMIESNETGTLQNNSLAPRVNMTGLANTTEFNVSINDSADIGEYSYRILGLDTYSNVNDTLNGTFEVWRWVTLNQSSLSPNDTYTEQDITMECQVVDANNPEPIQGKNVTFDNEFGEFGWDLTDADGWASITFQDEYAVPEYENISCSIAEEPYWNVTGNTTLKELLKTQEAYVNVVLWDDANFTTQYQDEQVDFYTNYTNQYDVAPENGTCNITFNGTWQPMSVVSGTENITWKYNRSFDDPGFYQWNVTCDNPLQPSIKGKDNITINDSEGPNITLLEPVANRTFYTPGEKNFTYNVTDYSNVTECRLFIDDVFVAQNTTITKGVQNNFTYDVQYRGDHNWSVRCYDDTPLANNGTSETRDFSFAYPSLDVFWAEIPEKVYRNEVDRKFVMTISNTGTNNATNVTLNMTAPYGWEFSPGNQSNQTLPQLDIGEATNVTWFIDINSTAPLGLQNVTVNVTSDQGANTSNRTLVKVGAKDVETYSINTPVDDGCGFSEPVDINATIYNPGENTTWFTVLFKVNGTMVNWTNITTLDFDEYHNVSYTHRFGNESHYNITVETNLSSDTDHSNDAKSAVYRKYNPDISLDYDLDDTLSNDEYGLKLTAINRKNCTYEGYELVHVTPDGFTMNATPTENHTQATTGLFPGDSKRWILDVPPLGTSTVDLWFNGTGDYYTNRLMMMASG